jgi:hypothetical protein
MKGTLNCRLILTNFAPLPWLIFTRPEPLLHSHAVCQASDRNDLREALYEAIHAMNNRSDVVRTVETELTAK